jgi:hypothetical protein
MRRSTPMATVYRRRHRCAVKVGIPAGGFGIGLNELHAWLVARLGKDGYAIVPEHWDNAPGHGDAVAILFDDPADAVPIAGWCAARWPTAPT